MFPSLEPVIQWAAHRFPDAKQRRAMSARSAVAAASRRLMEAWQESKAAAAGAGEAQGPAAGGAGSVFKSVIAQGFSFLAAGFETTSSALSIALYLLATHHEAAARLRAEVEGLPYTDAVVKETLRLHPGGTFLVRQARNDVDLGGGRVAPKGSLLCLATHALHHDPAQWPDPEAFRPERFLAPEGQGQGEAGAQLGPAHPGAYSPFGFGARMCVGHKLAMMVAKAVLLTLYRRYDFAVYDKQVTNFGYWHEELETLHPEDLLIYMTVGMVRCAPNR
ncbi:hypothetical protein GPECTOR_4g850 [Gonium pectorale]|uniref:Cytochrome P450 n=1 Tax=Gonium pectorale TaxID=33097 RepID=A0A150GZM7_GONPE|nr:hypothetical protein GPECTOR_4g850 [Gonium pectorale]|eukprot:KXZ54780.1 hypothetical protein GPECTOR_4g850 [Gonium pectorale]